jgi:hypothetical protein
MTDEVFFNILNILIQNIQNINNSLTQNSGYLARNEIKSHLNKLKNLDYRLEHFGEKIYSQNDEDGIIREIFNRLNINKGIFCEIGLENGLECNSLYLLLNGWKGIWIEGNIDHKEFINQKFKSLFEQQKLHAVFEYINPENINGKISNGLEFLNLYDSEIDFLSIDIDGMDIHLLKALTLNPKVICIEYNGKFPPPLRLTPKYSTEYVWKTSDYMGSSLSSLNDVASAKNYLLVGTNITGANAFFVREDLVGNKFGDNFTPEHLYNPARYYLTFHHFNINGGHSADFGDYLELL